MCRSSAVWRWRRFRASGAPSFGTLDLVALCVLLLGIFFLRDGYFRANGVLAVLGSVACLLSVAVQPMPRLDLKRAWPYLAYLVALTVSLLLSRNAGAWVEYGRQLLFLALVFAVARTAATPGAARVVLTLAIVCTLLILLSAIGFGAWLDYPVRPVFYESVIQWSGYPELGLLAAIGAAACLAVVALGRLPALQLTATLLSGFFIVAALLLYSRSAWVTISLVAVWIAVLSLVRWRRWKIALAIGILLVVCAGTALSSPLPQRYLAMLTSGSRSIEVVARLRGWEAAAAMIRGRPWFGVGPGNYATAYARYSAFGDPTHAYNLLLHQGAELGLVGLACYLAVWGRVLIASFRRAGAARHGLTALAVHAMLVAFFVRSQSEHFLANLSTSLRFLLLLAVLFGLTEALAGQEESHPFQRVAGRDSPSA